MKDRSLRQGIRFPYAGRFITRIQPAVLLATFVVMAAGCSGGSNTTVTGQVTIDDAPVACGVITFLPADGTGPSAQAVIENGQYVADVPPGLKSVKLEIAERKGTASAVKTDGAATSPTIYETISPIEYNADQQSDLKREVSSSQSVHDFHLKS